MPNEETCVGVLINGSWFEIVCSTLNVVDYDL